MSETDLAAAVRDLGGNDEDINLLADADFSGSDWEDSANSSAMPADLQKDVAAMWSQLSGTTVTVPTKPAKAKKEVSTKVAVSKGEPKAESKAESKAKSKPESKPESKLEPKAKSAKNEKKKGEDSAKKPEPVAKKVATPVTTVVKPKKIPPMSKKDRLAWEQFVQKLQHPGDLVITDQVWSDLASAEPGAALAPELITTIFDKAKLLLQAENQQYFRSKQSDREFSSSMDFLKSGTFSDQLGTLSILATESPLHSVRFLENLISKCEIKNRESACRALEVTKDLLVSHVLPDRRLRWFKDQSFTLQTTLAQVVSYAFEDFLKRLFFQLLQTMERLLADTVENIRVRTLNCIFDFFQAKPEQEANLLRLGLNKLGDPAGKVASRVKRRLMDALQQHPAMKLVVASAMDETLGRTTDYRTRYYAVDTLSEFIFSNRDHSLANKVIYIYLELFERLLNESKTKVEEKVEPAVDSSKKPVKTGKRFRPKRGKKGGLVQHQLDATEAEQQRHARLVAKLFTGLNRAFPFSDIDPAAFSKYTDTMYQMSHSPNVGTFIEALSFIFQISKTASQDAKLGNSSMDRYFRALYDSLLDSRLPHSSKLGKYIHLLLKSMAELKAESEQARSAAMVKRMLQVALNLAEVGAAASLIHVTSLSPHHAQLLKQEVTPLTASEDGETTVNYDPKQRDPRYARAETTQAWETLLLQQHYHPTVALYARNLVADGKDRQDLEMPDIEQYSVNQFLSKWAYKKPKAKESTRGGSIFQPLAGFTDINLGVRFAKRDIDETPASMQDWKSKNRKDVAPEDQFMYDYFVQRPERKAKPVVDPKNIDQQNDDDDEDSLDEDEINEAMSRVGPGNDNDLEMNLEDMSDDEDDGDLDDALNKAFNSDNDDDDEGANASDAGEGSDDENVDFAEMDGDLDGDFGDDDGELQVASDDDFAQFDSEKPKSEKPDAKKRKRAWTQLPTFLDADQFEEMYEKKAKRG